MAKWRWGDVHQTQFPHKPFSQVDMLKRFFHRSIETGGDNFTVDPSPYKLGGDFSSTWVPSYRQIIDLGNWDNSRFVHTTGQSGNVLSTHYDDLIQSWRKVEYSPMYWRREKAQQQAKETLQLQPSSRPGNAPVDRDHDSVIPTRRRVALRPDGVVHQPLLRGLAIQFSTTTGRCGVYLDIGLAVPGP